MEKMVLNLLGFFFIGFVIVRLPEVFEVMNKYNYNDGSEVIGAAMFIAIFFGLAKLCFAGAKKFDQPKSQEEKPKVSDSSSDK